MTEKITKKRFIERRVDSSMIIGIVEQYERPKTTYATLAKSAENGFKNEFQHILDNTLKYGDLKHRKEFEFTIHLLKKRIKARSNNPFVTTEKRGWLAVHSEKEEFFEVFYNYYETIKDELPEMQIIWCNLQKFRSDLLANINKDYVKQSNLRDFLLSKEYRKERGYLIPENIESPSQIESLIHGSGEKLKYEEEKSPNDDNFIQNFQQHDSKLSPEEYAAALESLFQLKFPPLDPDPKLSKSEPYEFLPILPDLTTSQGVELVFVSEMEVEDSKESKDSSEFSLKHY